jgi:hypothetical protein
MTSGKFLQPLTAAIVGLSLQARAQLEEPFGPACEQANVVAECGGSGYCCIANPRIKSAPATPVCTKTLDTPRMEGTGYCCNVDPRYRTWIKDGRTGSPGTGYEWDPSDPNSKRECPSDWCEEGYRFPNVECCATTGAVVDKYPAKDPNTCPNLHPHVGYLPSENGCGPKKFKGVPVPTFATVNTASYYRGLKMTASFLMPCNFHDVCYGSCDNTAGTEKAACDDQLQTDMQNACDSAYASLGPSLQNSIDGKIDKSLCDRMVKGYTSLVRGSNGDDAWTSAQGEACDCC